jgi:hypothetical protein
MPQNSAPHTYRVDAGMKDNGRALLDGGFAAPSSVDDDPIDTGTTALAIGEDKGTCKAPGKYIIHAPEMQACVPSRTEHTSVRPGCDDRLATPPTSTWGRFARRALVGAPICQPKRSPGEGRFSGSKEWGKNISLKHLGPYLCFGN